MGVSQPISPLLVRDGATDKVDMLALQCLTVRKPTSPKTFCVPHRHQKQHPLPPDWFGCRDASQSLLSCDKRVVGNGFQTGASAFGDLEVRLAGTQPLFTEHQAPTPTITPAPPLLLAEHSPPRFSPPPDARATSANGKPVLLLCYGGEEHISSPPEFWPWSFRGAGSRN